jgi:hypothetical protein
MNQMRAGGSGALTQKERKKERKNKERKRN